MLSVAQFSTAGSIPFPMGSNGKLEGINNKIGATQRMHYGLRDFLSLRILTLHKAKHTFCG
ncbi:MAG: hypothetical protein Fur0032_19170 [Terrimicrobiaceae bacterium]